MKRPEIPIDSYPTVLKTGAAPGDIICGIGYNEQDWLGLHLVVVDNISPGTTEINGKVRINRFGNLLCGHEKFRDKQYQKISLAKFHLRTENFTKIENIWPITQRFELGEKAVVIQKTNSPYQIGDVVTVHSILKYPDQRQTHTTYYNVYTSGKKPSPKLDSGMNKIM